MQETCLWWTPSHALTEPWKWILNRSFMPIASIKYDEISTDGMKCITTNLRNSDIKQATTHKEILVQEINASTSTKR